MMQGESALPEGWRERFFKEADLGASLAELHGRDHFFAETMRGHIRSLQLRFDEAWEHLDRASELSRTAPQDVPNLVRRFLLEIYRFETALVESPVPPSTEAPGIQVDVPAEIRAAFPEVQYVLDMRKSCEAKLLLHLGQCERAAQIYGELVLDNPDTVPENLVTYYLNLAACQHGLGQVEDAERTLENAALATLTLQAPLSTARAAAILCAFYAFLGDDEKLSEWQGFLLRLACPEETKELFVTRAERLLDRCLEHARLVTF